MYYNIIAATDIKNGIGLNGAIPWKCKSDLKRFSKLTKGTGYNAIIMGRKTWDSLPNNKPLPGRTNIVLTKNNDIQNSDNVFVFNTVHEIKAFCIAHDFHTGWIIGGEQIYRLFIDDPDVEHLYLTEISGTYECDTFFPSFNGFKIYQTDEWEDEETDITCKLRVYERR